MCARIAPVLLALALIALAALSAGLLTPTPAWAQDMRAVDRRLMVATSGFAFNEAAALEALAAGADINARNPAMDNDTLLIAAIRQFREPVVIAWLLDHGADPAAANGQARNAASYFKQYHMERSAEGRAVLARLEGGGGASGAPGPQGANNAGPNPPTRPAPAPYVAPGRYTPPAPQARAVPSAAEIRAATAAAAAAGGPIVPGVYQCMNQQAQISMMAFGIIDGSAYMTDGGRRGRYAYDARTGVLTLDSGAAAARYRRTGANLFRPLLPNGQLGGFTCPLNRAKSPTRPPW